MNGDPTREVPLTDRGQEEARRLGEQVANLPLDSCVHTRFPRTRETAEIALGERVDVPLVVEPLLDDIDIGDLEGETIEDYRAWKHGHTRNVPFPGGESLDDAARRYAAAFRSLLESLRDCSSSARDPHPLRPQRGPAPTRWTARPTRSRTPSPTSSTRARSPARWRGSSA